jgi:hypothetical protein
METREHAEPYIIAQGHLAEVLKSEGLPGVLEHRRNPKGLAKWKAIEGERPGQHCMCPLCNGVAFIKRKPNSASEYYAAHLAGSAPCPWSRKRSLPIALDLETFDEVFPPTPTVGGELSIRLPKRAKAIVSKPGKLRPESDGGISTERARRSEHSLFGFLCLLLEFAGLNSWWPGRTYAKAFQDLIAHLAWCVSQAAISRVLGGFGAKLFFPECPGNFFQAIDAAANAPGSPRGFDGRAIVIGRLFDYQFTPAGTEVKLSWMGAKRLIFEKGDMSYHWNSHVYSFGKALRLGAEAGFRDFGHSRR